MQNIKKKFKKKLCNFSDEFIVEVVSKYLKIVCVCLQRQLETLGAQRAGLEDMLKEMKRKVIWVQQFTGVPFSSLLRLK